MHGGDILMWLLSSNATGTCHLSLDTETSRSCSISGSQKFRLPNRTSTYAFKKNTATT